MSSMKSVAMATALLGLAMMSTTSGGTNNSFSDNIKPESPEEMKRRKKYFADRTNKDKGLTAFDFPGGNVWALNKKTANKKAKKLGYL